MTGPVIRGRASRTPLPKHVRRRASPGRGTIHRALLLRRSRRRRVPACGQIMPASSAMVSSLCSMSPSWAFRAATSLASAAFWATSCRRRATMPSWVGSDFTWRGRGGVRRDPRDGGTRTSESADYPRGRGREAARRPDGLSANTPWSQRALSAVGRCIRGLKDTPSVCPGLLRCQGRAGPLRCFRPHVSGSRRPSSS
jgi:hypothetical protein